MRSPVTARLLLPVLTLVALTATVAPAQVEPTKLVGPEWDQGYEVPRVPAILSARRQTEVVNGLLRDRLDNLLPELMRAAGLDMWIVINREYNEDPVYLTLVPEPVFAARRTTILVFHDRGEAGVERLTVSRYGLGEFYESSWDGGSADEQWERLAAVVRERNPERIGINTSRDWAIGDGLTAGLRQRLETALGDLKDRLTSAERLCVRWLETRTKAELEIYPQVVQLARSAIAEAFSNRVITPGVTTTDDVYWYLRERYRELGLPVWFQPYCNVQRRDPNADTNGDFLGAPHTVIQRGDILHTDVGIRYLRLCTDTQEMAYVLRADEADVPQGLKDALRRGNEWQDLLTSSFVAGRTGNEILAETLKKCASEGIRGTIYTHPLGHHGHGAGPTIGMWDNQGPTPVRGDWRLHANTCYAIEGNIKVQLPEWDGQWVQIKLEQDAVFDGEKVTYLGGRQTRWHIVR
ncbi:MAG: aminopeptidase P family protein [bacterium]|nr:aminopeptidase P family protein [bacterium]